MQPALVVLLLASAIFVCGASREQYSLDLGWRFHLGDFPGYLTCNATFPTWLNNTQCYGLSQAAGAQDASDCAGACCEDDVCLIWQWCPVNDTSCGAPGECWIGSDCSQNVTTPGWISAARSSVPPVPPPPPYSPDGPTGLNFTDASWRTVNVPHDFVIEGNFSQDADRSHGYLPFNISWYRRHFTLPAAAQGSLVWVDFNAVYRNSDVWLNGVWLGHRDSGYVSFRYWMHNATTPDGAPVLNYGGGDNVLVVRADALTAQELWSYEGGGITSHVYLNVASNLSIVPWGVYVPSFIDGSIASPMGSAGQQTASSAQLLLQIDAANANPATASFEIVATVYDASGASVATASASQSLSGGGWIRALLTVSMTNVSLWSPAAPYLYTLLTQVTQGGVEVDAVNTTFGVRDMYFDANQGLIINGFATKIRGVCNHEDFAGVGVAVPDRVNEFRVKLMQSFGANAWRTAHNPVHPELMDFADRLGMLMWVENRFINPGVQPLAPSAVSASPPVVDPQLLRDCQDMVLRDRNHPSVYTWSLCNEGGCQQGNPQGNVYSSAFKAAIYAADTTRPVTANTEYSSTDTFIQELDLMSFSYNYGAYDTFHELFPFKPLMGGEAASCLADRGYYGASNATTGHVNADDMGCVTGAWAPAATQSFVAGNNAWTGMDYRGEPTPYSWPDVNSHFGIADLSGFLKDSAYWYMAWWRNDSSVIHVYPGHWTDPVPPGTAMSMHVFAAASSAELFVNGASQGRVTIPPLGIATWSGVTYARGNATAVSYDASGAALASVTMVTAGSPTALRVWLDAGTDGIYADEQDTALVGVAVVDAAGIVVGNDCGTNVSFTLTGVPGAAVTGVGNGDPSDLSPNKATWRLTFNALVRALVTAGNATGVLTVTASAAGLAPGNVSITLLPPPAQRKYL